MEKVYLFCLIYRDNQSGKNKRISEFIEEYKKILKVSIDEPVYYRKLYNEHIEDALIQQENNIKYCEQKNFIDSKVYELRESEVVITKNLSTILPPKIQDIPVIENKVQEEAPTIKNLTPKKPQVKRKTKR